MGNLLHIDVTGSDGGALGSYPIQSARLRIGRDPEAEISISTGGGGTVSWEHAVVEQDGQGNIRVRDVGSTNGTYLNGNRLVSPQVLKVGDTLRLGQQGPKLELKSNGGAPAAPIANLHQPGSRSAGDAAPFGYYQQPGNAPMPGVGNVPVHPPQSPAASPANSGDQAARVSPPQSNSPQPQAHQPRQPHQRPAPQPQPQPQQVQHPQTPALPESKSSGGTTRLMMIKMQQQSNMRWLIATSVAAIAVVGIGLAIFVLTRPEPSPESDVAVQELIEQVSKSVVTIEVTDVNGNTGNGSGFIYSDTGIIVTNFHVIDEVQMARVVFFDQSEVEVEGFLAVDPGSDVAILKIKPPNGMPEPLPLIDEIPKRSARVFALGTPKGFQGSVTGGAISAFRTGDDVAEQMMTPVATEDGQVTVVDIYTDVKEYDRKATWVQTDAEILPGNSGGPLVNLKGEVVGINTFFYASMSAGNDIHGTIPFASSFQNIKETLKHMSTEPRPLTQAWR